ncbi:Prenylated rab acceptor PRA1 [Dillenia turbinata]|uniref:PRA1 family protein n=1 Tax=Dillenia turbinata TaxID=194707 RepID=A0AAN8W3B7_9MAGN
MSSSTKRCRPWRVFLNPFSLSPPISFGEAKRRIHHNITYFTYNYSLVSLLILFLALIYHPLSLIVFLVVFVFWLVFYLSRNESLVIFGKVIDDNVVLILLRVFTVVAVGLTGVWLNVIVGCLVAVFIIVFHAAFRITDDLFVDEENLSNGLLNSVVSSSYRLV